MRLSYSGRSVPLVEGGEVVVGRSAGAEVVVDLPSVSRRHAKFEVRRGRVVVEDLGSHNGVYVNGVRVSGSTAVGDGDQVMIGEALITVTSDDRAVRSTMPPPGEHSTAPPPPAPVAARAAPRSARRIESAPMTAPLVVSPRMHLDNAVAMLDSGRYLESLRAFHDFLITVEGAVAHGRIDPRQVVQATIALIQLSDASLQAAPLELLFKLRRLTGAPLDAVTTEELARTITGLPRTDGRERLAYCHWLRGRQASFTERRAAKRLEEA